MTAPRGKRVGCQELRRVLQVSRRDVLQLGGLLGLNAALPEILRAQASAAPRGGSFGRAKQVILLYLHGGHPQQEMFDPKPEGPSAVRGEFGAISTSLPGVQFGELLPQTARIAHKLTIIRSLSHTNPNHVHASYPANTGHEHLPNVPKGDFPPSDDHFPPFGAVRDNLKPQAGCLPGWVRIGPLMRRSNGTVLHGQNAGFLGARHSSFVVDQSLQDKDVKVRVVQPSEGLSSARLSARHDLLQQLDAQRRLQDESPQAHELDTFYNRAFSLLSSDATRKAFELADEEPALRDRYGKTEFGQRCLLARRLAEAGVPTINVSYCHTPSGSWDTHSRHFSTMKKSLAPTFDTAFSALIDDLDERGMLETTLVVAMAEFGRTPTINRNAGRDHWPWVYSFALAGAGLRPGTVFGASDASAAYPTADAVGPGDFAATLYYLMGIDEETVLFDRLERPQKLVIGKKIDGVLA